jgi:hypothetical protein
MIKRAILWDFSMICLPALDERVCKKEGVGSVKAQCGHQWVDIPAD